MPYMVYRTFGLVIEEADDSEHALAIAADTDMKDWDFVDDEVFYDDVMVTFSESGAYKGSRPPKGELRTI